MKKYEPMQVKKSFQMHIQAVEKMLETVKDKKEILKSIDLPAGTKVYEQLKKLAEEQELKEQETEENEEEVVSPRRISQMLERRESILENTSPSIRGTFIISPREQENVNPMKSYKFNQTTRLSKFATKSHVISGRSSLDMTPARGRLSDYTFGNISPSQRKKPKPINKEKEIDAILSGRCFYPSSCV